MEVSIKTLEGKMFKVKASPDESVGNLKALIEKQSPEMKAGQLKLIHAGKVLKDEEILADKGITAESFLVCMMTKPKRPPDGMSQLEAMGFGQNEQSRAALDAANGNVDVAVEYLTNGIPEQQQEEPEEAPQPAGGEQQQGLAALRNHAQFDELRRTVQQNPDSLQQVLQHLGSQDPALLELIHANQQEFLAMMNEPVQEEDDITRAIASISPAQRAQLAATIGLSPEQFEQFTRQMQSMPRDQLRQLLGGGQRPQNVVRLTREESEAVGRLAELGFSRDDAAQAYLACDKNEALAANLLFDGFDTNNQQNQQDDDEDDDMYA